MDKCDRTAAKHSIESLPTIKLIRGTDVLGTIVGGGKDLLVKFAELWQVSMHLRTDPPIHSPKHRRTDMYTRRWMYVMG